MVDGNHELELGMKAELSLMVDAFGFSFLYFSLPLVKWKWYFQVQCIFVSVYFALALFFNYFLKGVPEKTRNRNLEDQTLDSSPWWIAENYVMMAYILFRNEASGLDAILLVIVQYHEVCWG